MRLAMGLGGGGSMLYPLFLARSQNPAYCERVIHVPAALLDWIGIQASESDVGSTQCAALAPCSCFVLRRSLPSVIPTYVMRLNFVLRLQSGSEEAPFFARGCVLVKGTLTPCKYYFHLLKNIVYFIFPCQF